MWLLELPFTKQLSLNDRTNRHVKAKLNAEWREAVAWLCTAQKIPACGRIKVELYYAPRFNRRRDQDNLVATLKPVVDGIVDAGVVPDDTQQFVERVWPIILKPTGAKHGAFWLTIEEL